MFEATEDALLEEDMNRIARWKNKITEWLYRMSSHDSESFRQHYYHKIIELVPELSKYKIYQVSYLEELAQNRDLKDLQKYYHLLVSDKEELDFLKQNLTYTGSHFFRGNDWDFFIQNCLAVQDKNRDLKIWCAGCSSGQEVYSLIVALLDYVELDKIHVLASDYNDRMLELCRKGSYFNMHLHEVPERYHRYLDLQKTKFVFKEEIRDRIETRNINLLKDDYPKGFDLILCRNVIKFFAPEIILQTQKKLSECLLPGGILFLSDDDESKKVELIKDPADLDLVQLEDRCIYQKNKS